MSLALDLSNRHFAHTRGPVLVVGTWLRVPPPGDWTPCLAIIRKADEKGEFCQPCVITMDKAWIFEERTGDPHRAAQILHSFVGPLRLTDEPKTMFHLAGIVHDLLGDFLTIPPHANDNQPKTELGDLTITDHRTGRTMETVLTDDV